MTGSKLNLKKQIKKDIGVAESNDNFDQISCLQNTKTINQQQFDGKKCYNTLC